MATKKIILDFKQQPIVGTHFQYKIYVAGVALTYGNGLNYVNVNYKAGADNTPFQIGIGTDLEDTLNKTVAFLNSANYQTTGFVGTYATSLAYAKVNDTIEITITSAAAVDLITIWEIKSEGAYIFIRPESPCTQMYLSNASHANANPIFAFPAGNYSIRNVQLGTIKNVVIPSTFDCLFDRGYSYAINDGGGAVLLYVNILASVSDNNLVFEITNNNLTIILAGTNAIVQYSLDGITYQDENVFQDIPAGTNTLYVKDALSCIKTYDIYNGGTTNGNDLEPYYDISEANSLRFVRNVDFQDCGNYKNVYNTLSCEENTLVAPTKFIQLFQACDTNIKTQLKTSYQNVEVYAKDTQGNLTEIIATKIVSYIGKQDKRDALYYSYNGQLAVMFLTGNLYQYGTLIDIGNYALNGLLPDYGTIGTWVETETYGILQVIDIAVNDQGQKSLILNANVTLVNPVTKTIQVIYNEESYDIWEFAIDMSAFLNKTFKVGVRFYQTDPDINFPDFYYKSEMIQVKTRWARSLELIWSNSKNTDIYFFSAIQMKNRLNFCDIGTNLSDGDIEVEKTDSAVIPIDATDYKAVEFEANFLTTGMMRKIKLALKHDFLVIENIPYTLAQDVEVERIGKTNMYKLKAKLFEAGDVWNTGTANTQTVFSGTELIGLLQGDGNEEFIRTQ